MHRSLGILRCHLPKFNDKEYFSFPPFLVHHSPKFTRNFTQENTKQQTTRFYFILHIKKPIQEQLVFSDQEGNEVRRQAFHLLPTL